MPKPPRNTSPPRLDAVDPATRQMPDAQPPVVRLPERAPNLPVHSLDSLPSRTDLPPNREPAPGTSTWIEITDSHLAISASEVSALPYSLADYVVPRAPHSVGQPLNSSGLEQIGARTFAVLKGVGQVHIEFDTAADAFRVTDLYGRLPPGPLLFKNNGEPTWSPIAEVQKTNPLKRPHDDSPSAGPPSKVSRVEVDLIGVSEAGAAREELLNGPFKALHPDKTPEEHAELLRGYNLSPKQHARLQDDLRKDMKIPEWAQLHKQQTEDANNPLRFDQLRQEIEPLIRPALREEDSTLKFPWKFEESVSRDFLSGFVEKLGYKLNVYNRLYRTDIPGLFRADERTLFELAGDGKMLPREKHPEGSTTGDAISLTVSLDEVQNYHRGRPDKEYLSYDFQTDTRPHRRKSSESSDGDDSDSSQKSYDSYDSDTTRLKQEIGFVYVVDTRGMEVVLRNENSWLNHHLEGSTLNLPYDNLEAHLSVPRDRGIPSERIWLMHSSMTKAANINDLDIQARSLDVRKGIAFRTRIGGRNQAEYDALINQVSALGKPILKVKTGAFADDIVWPESSSPTTAV